MNSVETIKSKQAESVFNYILDPSYTSLYNNEFCTQETQPGFSCKSTAQKHDVDNESLLLRGTQSYGIAQPEPKFDIKPHKILDDNRFSFGENYVSRQSKSLKSISTLENERYLNDFPKSHNSTQANTPLIDSFSLFGIDTRQAVKYGNK